MTIYTSELTRNILQLLGPRLSFVNHRGQEYSILTYSSLHSGDVKIPSSPAPDPETDQSNLVLNGRTILTLQVSLYVVHPGYRLHVSGSRYRFHLSPEPDAGSTCLRFLMPIPLVSGSLCRFHLSPSPDAGSTYLRALMQVPSVSGS